MRVFSADHKIIGLQYLFTSLVFLLLSFLLILLIRCQLAFPFLPIPFVGRMFGEAPVSSYRAALPAPGGHSKGPARSSAVSGITECAVSSLWNPKRHFESFWRTKRRHSGRDSDTPHHPRA